MSRPAVKPRKTDFHKTLKIVLKDNPQILADLQDLREQEQRQWEYGTMALIVNENPMVTDEVAAYAVKRSRTVYTAAERAAETQRILAHFGR